MVPLQTFEETYPRYPFAPLVALGTALGRFIARHRGKPSAAAPTVAGIA